jgi:hypothetical protein
MSEIYFSTDVETDGPIPGPNSMLSFGSAAFNVDGKMIGTFTRNLDLLDGATPDVDTMRWWGEPEQRTAWVEARKNTVSPQSAMVDYVAWIEAFPGIERSKSGFVKNAVFVGFPATFDFLFIYFYLIRFAKQSPFSFSALDIKTLTMAVLNVPFRDAVKRNMPKEWFPPDRPHTHVALDDAIEQGELFVNILRASKWINRSV